MMKLFSCFYPVVFVAAVLWTGCAAQKHHTEVVIVSTNDIHAAIDRMPALATLVERTRAVNPNVLVLDAGDKWTGNPYVDLNKEVGLPIVALLDSIGYDLSTVGNHGFDHGVALLGERIRHARFETVLANVISDTACFPALPAYSFRTVDGVKLGFLGLLDTSRGGYPDGRLENFSGVGFSDPLRTALRYRNLKDSCDLLVGLTHLGVDLDSTLAEQMPQLRLIVGGHSHTVLAGGGKSVNGVLITQTGKGLQYAGITQLKFRNRRLIGIENHLVPLDTISPDPKIAALVRQYEQAPELLRRVGETTVPMDKVALLNLQVDAILARTQTDFAFYNWNGMRIDTHAAAPFTVADVFAMEPFGSVLYQLPMRLSDLRELILNKFNYNGKEGHTVDIYPAGGTYIIVTNAEKQGVDVLFFDRDGRQLTDETRVFQVTLPDYLHSTYVFPLRGSGRALDLKVTDLLMDYLSGHRPLPVDTAMRVSIRPVQ